MEDRSSLSVAKDWCSRMIQFESVVLKLSYIGLRNILFLLQNWNVLSQMVINEGVAKDIASPENRLKGLFLRKMRFWGEYFY